MNALQHRIFVVPLRPDVDGAWAHEHWTTQHARIFGGNPALRGYVQNRPPRDAWSGRTHICAEAWFDDRDAEREAFRSAYYLDEVVEDEDRFVHRDQAWHSRVTVDRAATHPRRYRALVFGHTPATASDWLAAWDEDAVDVYTVERPLPLGGRRAILGLWSDDRARAEAAVQHFGPLASLTCPEAVVPVPEEPWIGAAHA